MNPRRVAITAAALFGTVILSVGSLPCGFGRLTSRPRSKWARPNVSNADAVSAATAVTAITKAALPDGSQRSAPETATRAARGGERALTWCTPRRQ